MERFLGGRLHPRFLLAAEGAVRGFIKERSKNACESCGESSEPVMIGHLNHARGENYNHPDNLRMHCWQCEALYHLDHIGKAKEIGLSEENNRSAAFSALTTVAMASGEKFANLYKNMGRQDKIDYLFSSRNFKISYHAFYEKYADMKKVGKKLTKKEKNQRKRPGRQLGSLDYALIF